MRHIRISVIVRFFPPFSHRDGAAPCFALRATEWPFNTKAEAQVALRLLLILVGDGGLEPSTSTV
jgi:hypothetical protein